MCSRSVLEVFWEGSGGVEVVFLGCAGSVLGVFWVCSGDFLDVFRLVVFWMCSVVLGNC